MYAAESNNYNVFKFIAEQPFSQWSITTAIMMDTIIKTIFKVQNIQMLQLLMDKYNVDPAVYLGHRLLYGSIFQQVWATSAYNPMMNNFPFFQFAVDNFVITKLRQPPYATVVDPNTPPPKKIQKDIHNYK